MIPARAAKHFIPRSLPITEALSPDAELMVHVAGGLLLGPHGAQKRLGWFGCHGRSRLVAMGLLHVAFLVDLRSRLAVMFDWFWSYLTYNRSMRLITGAEGSGD